MYVTSEEKQPKEKEGLYYTNFFKKVNCAFCRSDTMSHPILRQQPTPVAAAAPIAVDPGIVAFATNRAHKLDLPHLLGDAHHNRRDLLGQGDGGGCYCGVHSPSLI